MSYARPTLISQIVQKGRKVSINPRNEDEAAPKGGRELSELFSGPTRETTRMRIAGEEKRCREESRRSQVAFPEYLAENIRVSREFERIEWRD